MAHWFRHLPEAGTCGRVMEAETLDLQIEDLKNRLQAMKQHRRGLEQEITQLAKDLQYSKDEIAEAKARQPKL